MAERESTKTRLEEAVARLETAIGGVTDGRKSSELEKERGKLTEDLSALRTEHTSVTAQLQGLQDDYQALEKVVDQVTDRLDATIDRLRAVLDT
ncbi:MAG: DUF4164 family protein [Proteobacteria bacterium]|nr:DUF4164 family protein [Pseudomonadota bacterium]